MGEAIGWGETPLRLGSLSGWVKPEEDGVQRKAAGEAVWLGELP